MWGTMIQGVVVLLLLVSFAPFGINGMMIAYVVFNALWLFVWRHYAGKEIALTLGMFLRDMLPFTLLSTVVMIVTYCITLPVSDVYILLVARIVIAAILYISTLSLLKNKELREAANYLLKRKCKE